MPTLLEGLYPARCLGCEFPYVWLCSLCKASCAWAKTPFAATSSTAALPSVVALSWYAHPVWKQVIRAVKFGQVQALLPLLIRLAGEWRAQQAAWPWGTGRGYTLISIPTNPTHVQERGRDHAEVWGKVMQSLLPEAVYNDTLVQRRASSVAHAKLSLEASRLVAAEGSFVLTHQVPERVIVCDDVYTTGATMQTLARLLREQGSREVGGIVAAWAGGVQESHTPISVAKELEMVYE